MKLRHFSPWIVALVALGVFAPVLRHDFVDWDDRDMILDNPLLSRLDAQSLGQIWSSPHLGLYTPVTYTVWSLAAATTRAVSGSIETSWFHGLNLATHAACSVLVLLVLRRLVSSEIGCLVGAVLFAVHPIQVEAVSWCSSFNTVLSGLLCVMSTWLYLCERRRSACALYVLAMLSKPSAVGLPIAIVAIDVLLCHVSLRQSLIRSGWWLLLALPIALLAGTAQPARDAPQTALAMRPLVALDAVGFYLRQIAFPRRLCIDYGRTSSAVLTGPGIAVSWVAPVVAAMIVLWLKRRSPVPLAGFVVLVAALLPVLGLIPFDFQIYSTVADRYVYWGMLGVALVASWLVSHGRTWGIAASICTVIVLAWLAFRLSASWKDTTTLVNRTLVVNPQSLAADRLQAFWFSRRGQSAEAIAAYERVLLARPSDRMARFNLANTLLKTGDYAKACANYEMLQSQGVDDARLHTNFGAALMKLGAIDPAGEQFDRAVAANPRDPDALANLGQWLELTGKPGDAVQRYRQALASDPANPIAQAGISRLAP